jgi:response regulator NasT
VLLFGTISTVRWLFADDELQAALELAAARHAEFEALEAEVGRVQQALEDRKLVERAKGLLMSALHLSEQDAFRRLQLTARERNLRLVEVAARIVEQQSLLEPKRTTHT